MRISDWSSDVCSSDLELVGTLLERLHHHAVDAGGDQLLAGVARLLLVEPGKLRAVEHAGGVRIDALDRHLRTLEAALRRLQRRLGAHVGRLEAAEGADLLGPVVGQYLGIDLQAAGVADGGDLPGRVDRPPRAAARRRCRRDLCNLDDGRRVLEGIASGHRRDGLRSEEHTSELQSLMRISYAVFCLKKKNKK